MSYILDALKKSEQQRGHGGVPDIQTVHTSSLNYGNEKKHYWPYILITAVIINFLTIIYFIIDKDKTSENHAKTQQSEVMENTTSEFNEAVNKEKQTNVTTPKIISSSQLKEIDNSTAYMLVPINNPPAIDNTLQVSTNAGQNKPELQSKISENETSSQKTIVNSATVHEYYDLPESIQEQLPALIISAHVYSSNPEQRSIVINNKFTEEGEYVIDDLILYEITNDGAIFEYNGILFHYGVVSSWQQ